MSGRSQGSPLARSFDPGISFAPVYAASIRAELDRAAALNEKVRRCRQRAGALLREAGTRRDIGAIAREVGIDQRMIELLMAMAAPRRTPRTGMTR